MKWILGAKDEDLRKKYDMFGEEGLDENKGMTLKKLLLILWINILLLLTNDESHNSKCSINFKFKVI